MEDNRVTGLRLRECRRESGETLEQIGLLAGVNKSTVMRWEKGDTEKINLPTVYLLAEHFMVDPQWLLGLTEESHITPTADSNAVQVPVIGVVRGGCGGIVTEEPCGTEPMDKEMLHSGEEYFWLRVNGDSMSPVINDKDLVLVRRQEQVDSGRFAVVIVDGEEGLVKRVVYTEKGIELHSSNPGYPPRRFEGKDASLVTVVGLVVESKRKFI